MYPMEQGSDSPTHTLLVGGTIASRDTWFSWLTRNTRLRGHARGKRGCLASCARRGPTPFARGSVRGRRSRLGEP